MNKTSFAQDIAKFFKTFFKQLTYIIRTHIGFIFILTLCSYAVLRTFLNASVISALLTPARYLISYLLEDSAVPSMIWFIVSALLILLGVFFFCLAVVFIRNIFTTINLLNRDNKKISYKDILRYSYERLNKTFFTSFCTSLIKIILLALTFYLAYRVASPYFYFFDTKIMLFGDTKFFSSQFVLRFAAVASLGMLVYIVVSLFLSFSAPLTLIYDMSVFRAVRHSARLAARVPLRILLTQLIGGILSLLFFGLIALMLSVSIIGIGLLPYVLIIRSAIKYVFNAQLFLRYNYIGDVLFAYESKYYTHCVNLYKISF